MKKMIASALFSLLSLLPVSAQTYAHSAQTPNCHQIPISRDFPEFHVAPGESTSQCSWINHNKEILTVRIVPLPHAKIPGSRIFYRSSGLPVPAHAHRSSVESFTRSTGKKAQSSVGLLNYKYYVNISSPVDYHSKFTRLVTDYVAQF